MVYTALPGVVLSTDSRQCLRINAPHISSEILVTNDIVDLIAEDSFTWIARYDHVINSGGIKLIPELIETRYKNLIDTEFLFSEFRMKLWVKKLVLVIEGRESPTVLEKIQVVHDQWGSSVPKYEIPKEILFVESFVKTETGKINRSQSMQLLG